jgi:hypothetical protein
MRAKEFITEQTSLDSIHDGLDVAAKTLPYTYTVDQLKNQDFYDLYRFGVAIADVRGTSIDDGVNNFKPNFEAETLWNEKQVVSSFDKDVGKVIDQALKKIGKKGKTMVSSPGSEELDDVDKTSPIKPFKGYKK